MLEIELEDVPWRQATRRDLPVTTCTGESLHTRRATEGPGPGPGLGAEPAPGPVKGGSKRKKTPTKRRR